MNPLIDNYLEVGCGRCPLGGTADCKIHTWQKELRKLRTIVLDCGLTEELKWSQPCYTLQNKNILIITAFKEYCVISFLKGSLLQDNDKNLIKPGDSSQSVMFLKFTNIDDIIKLENTIKNYIFEAIEIEKSGIKINFKTISEYEIPIELKQKFTEFSKLKEAFNALTPGRQRGYLIHFSQPKQSKTRESRIEKCIPKILIGKGFFD